MFYKSLCAGVFDLSEAFQGTATVDSDGKLLEGENEFYTHQAPGFVRYGPNGEELVCRQKCFMQGRIDATYGFDRRFTSNLMRSAHFEPLLWDPQMFKYNMTSLAGTASSLEEIIAEGTRLHVECLDSEPQQPPKGFAILGKHVDDMAALATGDLDPARNRIFAFVRGEIAVTYACMKLTGWHNKKLLGFGKHLDDELETVTITALDTLNSIRSKLFSKEMLMMKPRHIVSDNVYKPWPGVVPEVGDPLRAGYLERQTTTRASLGGGIWIGTAYPQCVSGMVRGCAGFPRYSF